MGLKSPNSNKIIQNTHTHILIPLQTTAVLMIQATVVVDIFYIVLASWWLI